MKKIEINEALVGDISLKALKAFLEAARLKSFTAAADCLHVTPAAVSKQIRGLEDYLGTDLFVRQGRSVSLTIDGEMFKDAAQLSLINIHQAAERLRRRLPERETLTVCCSPAFSALWLHKRVTEFTDLFPNIEIQILATHNFGMMESGLHPDIYIAKMTSVHEGYTSDHLFDDIVYPVCSPSYLEHNPQISSAISLLEHSLLDISAYNRSQISEHIDWKIWLSLHGVDTQWQKNIPKKLFTSNDYPGLVNLALEGQGILLGWHHLIEPLIKSNHLVRPLREQTVMSHNGHYLSVRHDKLENAICVAFCNWIKEKVYEQNGEQRHS
jgi:LysR family glycine cleavage system transcriptional activator